LLVPKLHLGTDLWGNSVALVEGSGAKPLETEFRPQLRHQRDIGEGLRGVVREISVRKNNSRRRILVVGK
jgi:hypothetical protein